MNTLIPKDLHGIADYVYIPLVLSAPRFVYFEEDKFAARVCRVSGILVLVYTVLTGAKWVW